jgi:hypothetical protein
MTAKEQLLERAPGWSEAQAEAAMAAAQRLQRKGAGHWDELARRAAALRERQRESVDAVALVHEGREELARRNSSR